MGRQVLGHFRPRILGHVCVVDPYWIGRGKEGGGGLGVFRQGTGGERFWGALGEQGLVGTGLVSRHPANGDLTGGKLENEVGSI